MPNRPPRHFRPAPYALPLASFLALGGCLEHRGATEAAIDAYHTYIVGGEIAQPRLPPPERDAPWLYVADTPNSKPDLPTSDARIELTRALEAQRNAAQRIAAANGRLATPAYIAPPPLSGGHVADPEAQRPDIAPTTLPDDAVSPADAMNAEFLAKLEIAEDEEAAHPPREPIAPPKIEREIPLSQGIYWPWRPFLAWLHAPSKTHPSPKQSVVRVKKPKIVWPVKPLPLPELLYEAHDLTPPDMEELPVVPPAPPQPVSVPGFDIPQQAVAIPPGFEDADPAGELIRFNAQSDTIAPRQDEKITRLAQERGGRKLVITGFGGTFDVNLGLTPADQIREIDFGLLRARALRARFIALGVPESDIRIFGRAVGDGARVEYLPS